MARFWAGDYEALAHRAPKSAVGHVLEVAQALRAVAV